MSGKLNNIATEKPCGAPLLVTGKGKVLLASLLIKIVVQIEVISLSAVCPAPEFLAACGGQIWRCCADHGEIARLFRCGEERK